MYLFLDFFQYRKSQAVSQAVFQAVFWPCELNACSIWLSCVEGNRREGERRPIEKRGGRRTLLINAFLFFYAAEGAAAASVTNTFISSHPPFFRRLTACSSSFLHSLTDFDFGGAGRRFDAAPT